MRSEEEDLLTDHRAGLMLDANPHRVVAGGKRELGEKQIDGRGRVGDGDAEVIS